MTSLDDRIGRYLQARSGDPAYAAMLRLRRELPLVWREKLAPYVTPDGPDSGINFTAMLEEQYLSRGERVICEVAASLWTGRLEVNVSDLAYLDTDWLRAAFAMIHAYTGDRAR